MKKVDSTKFIDFLSLNEDRIKTVININKQEKISEGN